MRAYPPRLSLRPGGRVDVVASVPGSKSITNRALLIAALAKGRSVLRGALVAEDAEVMVRALRDLGARVDPLADDPATIEVQGVDGRWTSTAADLDLALSGTSLRFLAAAVCLGTGRFSLDGVHRMRERPIGDLVEALRALGVRLSAAGDDRFPPVVVEADGLPGGHTTVAGDRSSQFLSALLMVAPYAASPVTVEVSGTLQSKPFVDMTIGLMQAFGVEAERDGYRRFDLRPGRYLARDYAIEGDAMAAGYAWGLTAMAGGRMTVDNVGSASHQGDRRLLDLLGTMGASVTWTDSSSTMEMPVGAVLRGGTFDLNDLPDQAQTLAVLALAADRPVEIVNVSNLRIKETDRLSALATELRRLGAQVEEREDAITVWPLQEAPAATEIETYGDHRMAMAFALAGARWPGISLRDPGCVIKTYPGFFDDLQAWGVGVTPA